MQRWGVPQRITRPRMAVWAMIIALATAASLLLVACGGNDDSNAVTAGPTATAPSRPDATLAPTATSQSERPWAFLGTRLIRTAFPPADLSLYRSLLPQKFDMPDQPLVVVTVADYYDVTLPLVPYREGYVLLQCEYQGRTGWYTYTMPVDDETANAGGRAIGFDKYVADEITLADKDGVWTGRVVHGGQTVMEVVFSAEGEPLTQTGPGETSVLFNLMPPGEGPGVIEVKSSPSGEQTTTSTDGSARVKAGPDEPWAGLVDPQGSTIWAVFQEIRGNSVLEWSELE